MGGINTALALMDASKKALDIANELKNVELKEAILNLKEELVELREENLLFMQKLSLQANFNMIYEKNSYWNIKENETKEGPYCSVCWDKDKIAIRLTQSAASRDFYKCGNCDNEYCVHNLEQY